MNEVKENWYMEKYKLIYCNKRILKIYNNVQMKIKNKRCYK